ncbi:MAG: ester cyclase [Candidatus Dormibacteraceae bacterium]
MNAGVIKSKFKKAELDQAIKEYRESALPALAAHDGARAGLLLVNRETGDAISIAVYDSEQAAETFAPKAKQLSESLQKHRTDTSEIKREIYDIAASSLAETKAVVERGFKAFNAHDMEALARDAAPDIEATFTGEDKPLKGPQAVKAYNQHWIDAFPDARVEAKSTYVQDSTVIVEGVFTGTHDGTLKTPMGDIPATGRKVRGEFIQVYTVDRGLIKQQRLLFDRVDLMTQLGMAPAAPQQAVTSRH